MQRGTSLRTASSAPLALRLAVFALSALLIVSLAGVLTIHLRPSWFSSLRNEPPGTQTSPAATSKLTPDSTIATPGQRGDVPVIDAIEPSSGRPGEQVTVEGSGFFSTNHHVVVLFNGMVAPTDCPTEQRCVATIPSVVGTSPTVQIATAVARSNTLMFRIT